jgi:hypothetical protein
VSAFTGKFFVLHAGREQSEDVNGAVGLEGTAVLATAISEEQARQDGLWFRRYDAIWWEYEVLNGRILSGIPRWDIWVHREPESFRRAK